MSLKETIIRLDKRIKQLEEMLRGSEYTMKNIAKTELNDRITIQA